MKVVILGFIGALSSFTSTIIESNSSSTEATIHINQEGKQMKSNKLNR